MSNSDQEAPASAETTQNDSNKQNDQNNQNNNDNRRSNNRRPSNRGRNNNGRGRPPRHQNRRQDPPAEPTYDDSLPIMSMLELQELPMPELTEMANEMGVESVGALGKQSLVFEILKVHGNKNGRTVGGGVLEVLQDGFGFLRSHVYSFLPCPEDIYLSPSQIRRFSLRKGDLVIGQIRPPRDKERFFAMLKVESINGESPEEKKNAFPFENLTPVFPDERIVLELPDAMPMRIFDLLAPLGKGQRMLITAPPQSGRSTLIHQLTSSITRNHPEIEQMILLLDERPEEITELSRSIEAQIISTSFEESPQRHVQVAEMAIDRAKRLVEHGKDVVIFLDSLTRLARAYNIVMPNSGRILDGGMDVCALHKPRQIFAAARNLEESGSLTIIATVMTGTGSKMDDAIIEDLRGTATMELALDPDLAQRKIYPPVDFTSCLARREELLLHPEELERVKRVRAELKDAKSADIVSKLSKKLSSTTSNAEFLLSL